MRSFVILLAAVIGLAACGGESGQDITRTKRGKDARVAASVSGVPAVRTTRLDFAACLADEETAQTRCPSFALLSLDYMTSQCTAHGGTLKARQPSEAWSLDVDGDASAEILVDLVGNFDCEGAPGAFACGSGGCPYLLYKKREDTWSEIGAINADEAPGIEVLPAEEGKFSVLRGGCMGQQPCSELAHYEWNGKKYDRAWIDFKGHAVDVAPGGGLMTITQDTAVRDAPDAKKGQVLDEYPQGTAMIVIGKSRDAPWSFVSPCSSCRRGFIETALLTK